MVYSEKTRKRVMPIQISFELSDNDLEHFRKMMNEVITKISQYSPDEVLKKARAVTEKAEDASLPEFVRERMQSLQTLIDALEDLEWQLPEEECSNILASLAYFSEPNDLVPDHIPGLGYIDDAIMIELVIQDLSQDLNAYKQFCSFRKTEERRRGAEANVNRESWLKSIRTELRSNMRRRRQLFSR
ncbi:MAG: uncharacterized membrane protein YkvA (DUF1232 family) [Paraglaciecola sp.]|jgi:uncharacterized membrane protein YkvA (DUF1232 family)